MPGVRGQSGAPGIKVRQLMSMFRPLLLNSAFVQGVKGVVGPPGNAGEPGRNGTRGDPGRDVSV